MTGRQFAKLAAEHGWTVAAPGPGETSYALTRDGGDESRSWSTTFHVNAETVEELRRGDTDGVAALLEPGAVIYRHHETAALAAPAAAPAAPTG